ncbi:zinc-binding alcohol dehydrogenase family protein [Labilibacter marinus]|uniref:zinc-binding alcohol dehydrogenase family protein n=1 Tax=Labilibacter marinus TaxID=1477105 RepID=UPI000836CBF1|nr:zinc-binding alcohol dehydrogenase family protein [Labilibacter marinus]
MKAFQITGKGSTRFEDIAMPIVQEGEVLVRIKKLGYCGSDLNSFRGLNPLVTYPVIPGHELSGIIEEVGTNVPDTIKVGAQAAIMPQTACGKCSSCRNKRFNACKYNETLGVQRNGGLTEYLAVPWEKLIIDDSLNLTQLALLEPLAVGFHAAKRGQVKQDHYVVVLGCGVIGLGAIAGATAFGGHVIAVDLADDKLEKAKQAGAKYTINAATEDVEARVNEMTKEFGADVVIEAVGSPKTYTLAIDLVCFTGCIVYIGYAAEPVSFNTKFFVLKEMDIRGSRGSDAEDFSNVLKAVKSGAVNPEDIVSHTFNFEESDKAIAMWADDPSKVSKVVINL